MGTQIYINFLEDDQLHAGVSRGETTRYVRNTDEAGPMVMSFVDVTLADDVDQTWESFDALISQAIAEIGVMEDGRVYHRQTELGRLEIMPRPSYPRTDAEIKELLRWVSNISEKYGRTA